MEALWKLVFKIILAGGYRTKWEWEGDEPDPPHGNGGW